MHNENLEIKETTITNNKCNEVCDINENICGKISTLESYYTPRPQPSCSKNITQPSFKTNDFKNKTTKGKNNI